MRDWNPEFTFEYFEKIPKIAGVFTIISFSISFVYILGRFNVLGFEFVGVLTVFDIIKSTFNVMPFAAVGVLAGYLHSSYKTHGSDKIESAEEETKEPDSVYEDDEIEKILKIWRRKKLVEKIYVVFSISSIIIAPLLVPVQMHWIIIFPIVILYRSFSYSVVLNIGLYRKAEEKSKILNLFRILVFFGVIFSLGLLRGAMDVSVDSTGEKIHLKNGSVIEENIASVVDGGVISYNKNIDSVSFYGWGEISHIEKPIQNRRSFFEKVFDLNK